MSVLRVLGVCLLVISTLSATALPVPPDDVIMAASISKKLIAAWNSTDPWQTERGYCLSYMKVTWKDGHHTYVLNRMERARESDRTPYSMRGSCSDAAKPNVFLHVHPPTTCQKTDEGKFVNCYLGGPDAGNCTPSATDQVSLFLRWDPFAFIQCGKFKIAMYE